MTMGFSLLQQTSALFVDRMVLRICTHHHIMITPHLISGAAERAVQVIKQATKKMGTTIALNTRLARFLLVYRTTSHATTEMRPDELFIHRHLRTRLTLTQPNLAPTIEKHQQQQKRSHDQRNHLVIFSKNESELVRNQRGGKRWVLGRIVRQKGPVTYLVRVGTRIRFCHVDHLLTTGIHSSVVEEEEVMDMTSFDQTNEEELPSLCNPGNEVSLYEAVDSGAGAVEPSETTMVRHSSCPRQPTKCLIEEI